MIGPSLPARYTIRSILGVGGSGRVYRVHDSIRDLDLALKLVSPIEETWLQREFDTLRQVRHENLIQVFDRGTLESGDAYYTMELISGNDWGKQMSVPQSPDEVRRVLTGLLRGLAHLHSHAEIHGDLKPENVLLGKGGVVKVADVGMRGTSSDRSPQSGTPGYAAPEVWEGKENDVRSDLYSAGVMAYEALTGRHPFSGHTVREVVSGQLEGWVPSPTAHGVTVPVDLERAVMRAVERNPALRQGSADEFMDGFGVNDHIGEILGGKFVGRIPELAKIHEYLGRGTPGSPTLVQVMGPPGIGKSALLLEAAGRARNSGFVVVDLTDAQDREWEALSMALAEPGPTGERGASGNAPAARLGPTAEELWAKAEKTPLLLLAESDGLPLTGNRGVLVDLARYIWAVSVERCRQARVLILRVSGDASVPVEPFESRLRLEPMSQEETRLLIAGTFGAVRAEPSTYARIQAITGGNPARVRNVLTDLRERRELSRLNGEWTLREEDRLDTVRLGSLTDFLLEAWGRIGEDLRDALLRCALLPNGLSDLAIAAAGMEDGLPTRLASLETRGWIRHRDGRWRVASESVRRMVLERSGVELTELAAADLMFRLESLLEPEELGDLALLSERTQRSLDLGMTAARIAMGRSDYRLASHRFRSVVAIALELGMRSQAREAAVMLGETLHSLGSEAEAQASLTEPPLWDATPPDDPLTGNRAFLLGRIARAVGEIDRARTHLDEAIDFANRRGERSLWMRSHAELAEIDWQLGNGPARADAIRRISSVLDGTREDASLAEERAALTYGLGAALIYAGDRERAREILLGGFRRDCSHYWKMRIANAITSASHYLGDLQSALEWCDTAMRHADAAGVDNFRPRILANRGATLHTLGRYREAAEHDIQSANWAHRLGILYDYAAGREGAAINHLLLARYEEAIEEATDALSTSDRIGDKVMVGKALEIRGLALYCVGDLASADANASLASDALQDHEYVELRPRVDWLRAKISLARGDIGSAIKLLEAAIAGLHGIDDPEDNWGIEIELYRARSMVEDVGVSLGIIRDITRRAAGKNVLVAQTSGAIAISEILANHNLDDRDDRPLLVDALGKAEGAGVLEAGWRLSYRLGHFALKGGDRKESRARFAHSVRILREIAGRLTPSHRELYLALPEARSAIESMSLTT